MSPLNPHHHLIAEQLPSWSAHANVEQWRALRESLLPEQGLADAQAPWFANALPDLREAVLASQLRLHRAQQALAVTLKDLRNIAAFAESLLMHTLQTRHGLSIPSRTTELVLVRHFFTFGTYVTEHTTMSLLEAALHNFEYGAEFGRDSALALAGNAQFTPSTVVGQTTLGDSDTLVDIELPSETVTLEPLDLPPEVFASTCRQLDIGQRYQEHLQACFDIHSDTVSAAFIDVQREQLQLAADLAFMRHDIDGLARDVIAALAAEGPVRCWQLTLFDIPLHEVLAVDDGRGGLLLYCPGTERSLLHFSGVTPLRQHLAARLLQPATRNAFLRYVARAQHYRLLDLLQQNTDGDTLDPHLSLTTLDSPLFPWLYAEHVRRLKAEAALLAVPTAQVDEQARQRRVAQWQSLGMDTLMLAGFFIPGLGTCMTAVMVCQLLGEVFEGYEAWSIGDRHLALRHLESVGLNLALVGGLHAAGQVLPTLFSSPLMEKLNPVELADGSKRLWDADLSGYASAVQLPAELAADSTGQFLQGGARFIRMGDELYQVRLDEKTLRWRIVHPDNPKAYQPLLEHNGQGAWREEHEVPQAWSDSQAVRRLGLDTGALDDTALGHALIISGVDRGQLQAVHLAGAATPPLLTETLQRLALAKRLPELSAAQRESLQSPLPALAETGHERALARALEGLYEPGLGSVDSDRLLLACLQRLGEWPSQFHLEIRAASPGGELLVSFGPAQASQRAVLLKSNQGYEVNRGERPAAGPLFTDRYQALYAAVPPALRQPWGEVEALRERVQQLAGAERSSWPSRLWGPAANRTAPRLRLLGGAPLDPIPPPSPFFNDSVPARLRRLYPAITPEQVDQLRSDWQRAMRSPELELGIRETALQQLRTYLEQWAAGVARRQRASTALLNSWRYNSILRLPNGDLIPNLDLAGLELENLDLATLPMPNGLEHVVELDLGGNSPLSELPAHWFERLPNLRRLILGRCGFERLPQIPDAYQLTWLDMEGNRLRWDAQAQATLEQMSSLQVLDLSLNRLINAPDMTRMTTIRSLFMVQCGLMDLPRGLEHFTSPRVIDLSDNHFVRLPAGFVLPPATANALSLESDTLGLPIREQIEDYYQLHGSDLLVSDFEYEPLLLDANANQLQLWSRVPLNYRRELRLLIDDVAEDDDVAASHQAIWSALQRMDEDAEFRDRALATSASLLLDI